MIRGGGPGTPPCGATVVARLGFVPDPFQMARLRRPRRRAVGPRVGPHRIGQDGGGRLRRGPGPGRRRKAFYTTPLKALSNQKFAELAAAYGPDRIGLLTGDVSHRPDAPVVVMTTEVVRNMLFARSPHLAGLGLLVLDEVHYLQDPYRGSVWEEAIILAPADVVLVCLSATVSNADQLGAWLRSVHGPTEVIVEGHRPVTLSNHVAIAEKGSRRIDLVPLLVPGPAPPPGRRPRPAPGPAGPAPGGTAPLRGWPRPRRTEIIEALAERDMLPAIVFIFSRAACDDAVRQCLDDGVRLTTPDERAEIRERCAERTEGLPDDELRVLGYGPWIAGLEAGVAPHHAGMIPAFREAVEECFTAGLLQVVFATETLSLGHQHAGPLGGHRAADQDAPARTGRAHVG